MKNYFMIDSNRAQQLIAKGAVLFDVRDPVSFRDGTLPSAVNLTLRQVATVVKYDKKTTLIFFGLSNDDPNLKAILNYVAQMGFTKLYSLGNINNWKI